MRLPNAVAFFFFLISQLKLTISQVLPNITDIEYSATLFDHLLNSTDYDQRMRPTPRGLNEPVEVCILQLLLSTDLCFIFLG